MKEKLPQAYKNLYEEGKGDRGGSASMKEIKLNQKNVHYYAPHTAQLKSYGTRTQLHEHGAWVLTAIGNTGV